MIYVVASIEVNPGKADAFIAEFKQLVPKVHAEDGCIEYGPTTDVDSGIEAQGGARDNVVTIVEKWEGLDHLKAHLAAPHMGEYREKVKDLVAGVKLQILEPA